VAVVEDPKETEVVDVLEETQNQEVDSQVEAEAHQVEEEAHQAVEEVILAAVDSKAVVFLEANQVSVETVIAEIANQAAMAEETDAEVENKLNAELIRLKNGN
jgi:hypothetical protein